MPTGGSVGPARVDRVVGENVKKDSPPAPPILSVSVGTAGASRNWRFLQRMAQAGRVNRVCSAIICDYNSGTVRRMQGRTIKFKTARRDKSQRVVLPKAIPTADGFLLNPYEFGKHLGDVGDDLKGLVDQVYEQSQNSGSQPQLILEFLGFGGHAIVGLMLHQRLRERFPGARCLPVVALPADEMLHDWMRREVQKPETNLPGWMRGGTWEAYEAGMQLGDYGCCLVVDNRIDTPPNDDLAIGLSVIEAAGTDPMKLGSLPEALGGILLEGRGWVGMNVIRRVVPSRKAWTFGFPLRRLRPVWSSRNNDLAVQTKEAIKDCLKEGSLLERPSGMGSEDPSAEMSRNGNGIHPPGANGNGNYPPGANGNSNGFHPFVANGNGNHHHPAPVQQPRVYVTIPVPNHTVRAVVRNVTRQLKTEGFYEKHSEMDIRFGSANFPDLPDADEEYYETDKGNALHAIGRLLRWPFKKLWNGITWLFVGGQERYQKEMSVMAVSLYPVHGRIRRVDEILHRNAQDPNGDANYSGFGTRVHTEPPEPPKPTEAPEAPEAHAQEEPSDPPGADESSDAYAQEENPDPAEETVGSNAPSS